MRGQHHEIDGFIVDDPQQLIAWVALTTQVGTGAVVRTLDLGPHSSEISARGLFVALNEGLFEL
jgi:hypothetical protein